MYNINDLLKYTETLYKEIDKFIENFFLNQKKITIKSKKTPDINLPENIIKNSVIKKYVKTIFNENCYFSLNSINSMNDIINYYKNNYEDYYFMYNGNVSFFDIVKEENVCCVDFAGKNSIDINLNEKLFIKKIIDLFIDVFGFDKRLFPKLKIANTTKTTAYYDKSLTTIYINSEITGNFKKYVILHELMHYFHFSICDKSLYISEFDYGAGFREGIAIYLCEYFIKNFIKDLIGEHNLYLKQIVKRGILAMNIYKANIGVDSFIHGLNEIGVDSKVAKLQYLSSVKYPGYKESYFIYYFLLRNKKIADILQMMKYSNLEADAI